MRVLSELIADVRWATNETDENRFKDEKLIKFFNDAQDQIESIVFVSNPENKPFDKVKTISTVSGVDSYNLPSDIYARSAVSMVMRNNYSVPKVSLYELQSNRDGWTILSSKIVFRPEPSSAYDVDIYYTAKIMRLETVTDTPDLPNMCEMFLTEFVERKINAINSSASISNSSVFTSEERTLIADVFGNNGSAINNIAITNESYILE